MKRLLIPALLLAFPLSAFSQAVPLSVGVEILKAEDSRHYSPALQNLMFHTAPAIRKRAALAAGRIGNDVAVTPLAKLLETDKSPDVRAMAAFALGEIESAKGADAILKALQDERTPDAVRARAVEAAGKIAAANAKDAKAKPLGESILDVLDGKTREHGTILLAITAALRARPEGTDKVVARFLASPDARVRADAANTLARLRARNANEALREMLRKDRDPIARANAARALGAAEDKESVELLVSAATQDTDQRVRVSAINSLAALRDRNALDRLLAHGNRLLVRARTSHSRFPAEKNELLVIATALGRLAPNTDHDRAVIFLNEVRMRDNFSSVETEVALARVAPEAYLSAKLPADYGHHDHRAASAHGQALSDLAANTNDSIRNRAYERLTSYMEGLSRVSLRNRSTVSKARPDMIRAVAAFKRPDLDEKLRVYLGDTDVFVRAAAADLLAERPVSDETIDALQTAAASAASDKTYNDAQLSIINALHKLNRIRAEGALLAALTADDHLVRHRALGLLRDTHPQSTGIAPVIDTVVKEGADRVLRYTRRSRSKLGQVLNTDADYRRALSRKNGTVKAVLTTEKGTFTIDLLPEDAPLTVDNFVKLARSRYFNGILVHRVVPNFVMQDGDPRGDGNGGPGWSIRCEINMVPYDRGAVGMALSGKDTGGSQWFVTHSPQPHLDGGYTVFGRVNETDMKVVDNIVRGDKILSVRIIETNTTNKRGQNRYR